MAYKVRKSQRPQYAYAAGAASQDAGQRQSNRLLGQGQTMFLTVVITALLNVTVNGTGILNRGSVMAAFDEMGIQENGKDRQYVDPRILRFIAEAAAPSAPTAVRAIDATVANNTAKTLRETFRIYFAHPFSLNPRETNFIVSDPTADFSFFHKLNAANNGVGKIIAGGTATLQNVVVKVQQSLDQYEVARPTFIPTIRMVSQKVTGPDTDLEILLRPGNYVRGLVIQQDSNIGEVSDIINSLALVGDRQPLIGPEKTDFSLLTQAEEYDWGGNMLGAPGYAFVNFQEQGKLTSVWNPTQDTNLKLVVNCQPSVVAGVTTSIIRVAILELERDASKVDLAGNALVGPLDIAV